MAGVILDSDALLAAMNFEDVHHKSIIKRLLENEEPLYISVVTYSEALVYPFEKDNYPAMSAGIRNLVSEVFDVTISIATKAAEMRAKTRIKLPDALIAATAIEKDLTLLTFDEKLAKKTPRAELLR
jgi:predicted nucleic acid-binding protein